MDIVTILSMVGVIVTGIASILWSNQYRAAKQAELDAKEAQLDTKDELINSLEKLSSPKILEAYLSTKQMLEEYIDRQKENIKELGDTNKKLAEQIDELKAQKDEASKSSPPYGWNKEFESQYSAIVGELSGTAENYQNIQAKIYENNKNLQNIMIAVESAKLETRSGNVEIKVVKSPGNE